MCANINRKKGLFHAKNGRERERERKRESENTIERERENDWNSMVDW